MSRKVKSGWVDLLVASVTAGMMVLVFSAVFVPDRTIGQASPCDPNDPNSPPCTSTPTSTPTDTPTATPTETPTSTPTDTPTATPTETPTSTPTDTPTQTPTNTPTNTPTQTPTSTPTNTPTNTPTQTPTSTPTNTPTNTPTPTPWGPRITGGNDPGSTSVTGVAEPDEAGNCIIICENGADNDYQGCTGDDEILNTGQVGTTSSGTFTAALNRELVNGDVICAYDLCVCGPGADLPCTPPGADPIYEYGLGNCVLVLGPAPAPAMSSTGTTMAVIMLTLIGLAGLVRLRWEQN